MQTTVSLDRPNSIPKANSVCLRHRLRINIDDEITTTTAEAKRRSNCKEALFGTTQQQQQQKESSKLSLRYYDILLKIFNY